MSPNEQPQLELTSTTGKAELKHNPIRAHRFANSSIFLNFPIKSNIASVLALAML